MNNLYLIMPEIKRAAKTVAYKWPQVTTEDDMVQSLSVRLLESSGSVDKLIEMEYDQRLSSLIRVGHQIASSERDDYDVFTGRFYYSVDEIKTMLKVLTQRGRAKAFNSAFADLSNALDDLDEKNPDQVQAIRNRYVLNTKTYDKDVLSRAIQSVTVQMNRSRANKEYDYNNGGRFRNNSAARAQTNMDYYGEADTE